MQVRILIPAIFLFGCQAAPFQQDQSSQSVTAYEAYRSLHAIGKKEWQEILDRLSAAGLKAVNHPDLQSRGIVVIEKKAGGADKGKRSDLLLKMHALPVSKRGGALVIPTGRYFLRFAPEVPVEEARQRLREEHFEILSEPGRLTSMFVVRRSASASQFEADLQVLKGIQGVSSANMDDLILRRP